MLQRFFLGFIIKRVCRQFPHVGAPPLKAFAYFGGKSCDFENVSTRILGCAECEPEQSCRNPWIIVFDKQISNNSSPKPIDRLFIIAKNQVTPYAATLIANKKGNRSTILRWLEMPLKNLKRALGENPLIPDIEFADQDSSPGPEVLDSSIDY
jgi:hypothetical protein